MSYARLYELVQAQTGKISTRWLREKAIELSGIVRVKEQWSGVIDSSAIRGFYIEGPIGPPVPLLEKESLIVLARSMCSGPAGSYWRRFIYTKELMHVFDEDIEKADTEQKFDRQIEKFGDPKADMSPQFRAEQKALWRACGALCQEKRRLEIKQQLSDKEISFEVIATTLGIPSVYVRELIRDDFEVYMHSSM